MQIGEISYTSKIIRLVNGTLKDKKRFGCYDKLLYKDKDKNIALKKPKGNNKVDELDERLGFLFLKLQYLSITLFDFDERTHINSETWILELIKDGLANNIPKGTDSVRDRVLPLLCTYLSIGKYFMFIEDVRNLYRSKYEKYAYMYTTWLNALEEYHFNCLDDSFWHLVQFFDEAKLTLDVYSKLLIAEKIVGLGMILLGAPTKDSILITKNLLKHFKYERADYSIKIMKHKGYSVTEVKAIKDACRDIVCSLLKFDQRDFSKKKCSMIFKYTCEMLTTLFLNTESNKEFDSLIEALSFAKSKNSSELNNLIKNANWHKYHTELKNSI